MRPYAWHAKRKKKKDPIMRTYPNKPSGNV
jgi:hypothetical protein